MQTRTSCGALRSSGQFFALAPSRTNQALDGQPWARHIWAKPSPCVAIQSLYACFGLLVRQRDDVALTLALLADRPDAAGLGIDMNGGNDKIEEALDTFIKKGETDFLG